MAKLEIKIHISTGIINTIPGSVQFGSNYIQDCGFAAAIVTMENGYVFKIKNPKIYFRENAERIIAFKKLFAITSFLETSNDAL